MFQGLRKSSLITISNILSKIKKITVSHDKKLQTVINGLIKDVQLLKNDIMLAHNHNYYLQCRLTRVQEELLKAERSLTENEFTMKNTIDRLKLRYQKQIQSILFNQFTKNALSPEDDNLGDVRTQSAVKERKNMKNISTRLRQQQDHLYPEEILSTAKRYSLKEQNQQKTKKKQRNNRESFNLNERVILNNVQYNEELAQFSEKQDINLNEQNFNHTSKKKKPNLTIKNDIFCHKKRKSEQLADLVSRQFKIPSVKQQYFSIDLL